MSKENLLIDIEDILDANESHRLLDSEGTVWMVGEINRMFEREDLSERDISGMEFQIYYDFMKAKAESLKARWRNSPFKI